MGRFKKGGVPDATAAARSLLEDWNSGRIKYYTLPPEDQNNAHISSSIVSEVVKEFDLENLSTIESEVLNNLGKECENDMKIYPVLIESVGPIESVDEEMFEDHTKKNEEKPLVCLF